MAEGSPKSGLVGFTLWWAGGATLRRYTLPHIEAEVEGPLTPSFEWQCAAEITASAIDPAGTLYMTGHADGGVAVWDNRLGACHQTMPGHKAAVRAVT